MSLKIFIGSSSNNEDAAIESIYEYTLRKNSSIDLDITWMRQSNDFSSIWSGWNTAKWFTPFSGFRWAIPEICNFKGRALYTDVDMINFVDISKLFDIDLKDKPFGSRVVKLKNIPFPSFKIKNLAKFKNPIKISRFSGFQPCVMLIDCEKAKDFLDPVQFQKNDVNIHNSYMQSFIKKPFFSESKIFTEIDPRWNCLDGENLPIEEIFQLHFTNMSTQPWEPEWFTGERKLHPREDIVTLFYELLEEASQHGFSPKKYLGPQIRYEIIGS
jgi:lipopolysaccharide biosynthesis glycosyltransferase